MDSGSQLEDLSSVTAAVVCDSAAHLCIERGGSMGTMSTKRQAMILAYCATLALSVAGCGGGSKSSNPATPPTAGLSAKPLTINLGQTVALAWSSTDASSCTESTSSAGGGNFTGMGPASGSQSVAPTAAGVFSYTLSCSGAGGSSMPSIVSVTVNPSILSTLHTFTTIGSTIDPIEGGGNPYGLAIAPISAGLINAGDLIICNFNDSATNTQGDGTTIVGLHPAAGSSPRRIAQSSSLEGCNALTMLPDDSISAAAFVANLNPLVAPTGVVNNPFSADTFQGPWGEAFAPAANGNPAALYVSDASGGTIDRISLDGDVQTAFTEIAKGFCVSGVPGAVFAPSGLTYDPSIDTLYVVDTSSYSVVAFANVTDIGQDGVVVEGNCPSPVATPSPVPTFSGPSTSSARVIAAGGAFNAPISAALLSDGDLIVGNGDINNPPMPNLLFEVSPAIGFVGNPEQLDTSGTPGALFGLATVVDGNGHQIIYFNDDNTNSVVSLTE